MSVVLTQSYTQYELLTTGNNWVIKFNTDSAFSAKSATVAYSGKTFTIDPSPTGKFEYHFKDSVNRIVNTNDYKDELVPDLGTAFVYNSTGYYLSTTVTITITLENNATEQTTIDLRFKKAAYDRKKYLLGYIDKTPVFDILLPKHKDEYYALITDNQPFDVGMYKRDAGTIQVTNSTTSSDVSPNPSLTEGVNRLYINDGNGTSLTTLGLQNGWNKIEFTVSGVATNPILNIFRITEPCVTVVKWYNNEGGWSYHPFPKSTSKVTGKLRDVINRNNDDLENTKQPYQATKYLSEEETELIDTRVEEQFKEQLRSLIESPMVYLLLRKSDDTAYWHATRFNGSTFVHNETDANSYQIKLKFIEPRDTLEL